MNRRQFFRNTWAVVVPTAGTAWLAAPRTGEGRQAPVRPPGALPEDEFLSRCIRCLRCAEACPNNAILPSDASAGADREGTPWIQPRRQACMLCLERPVAHLPCTEACPSGALELIRRDPEEIQAKVAMGKAELDTKLCYSYNNWTCGACYRACPFPEKAMTLGLWERPEVIAEGCVGCGLCERSCIRYPQAIRVRPRPA